MGKLFERERPSTIPGTDPPRRFSDAHFFVALALADHGNDDGSSIHPGIARVAWKVDRSPRQVQRIMRDLEALGLVVKVADAYGHRPAEYWMDLDALAEKPPPEGRDPEAAIRKQRMQMRRRVDQDGHAMDVRPTTDAEDTQDGHAWDVTPAAGRTDKSDVQDGQIERQDGHSLDVRQTSIEPSGEPSISLRPDEIAHTPEAAPTHTASAASIANAEAVADLQPADTPAHTPDPADAARAEQWQRFEAQRNPNSRDDLMTDWARFLEADNTSNEAAA